MPLSDEEARLLQQLEQSLAAEDPDFASTLRGSAYAARNRRLAIVGVLGLLLGIGVLFAGVVTQLTFVGVAGFVLMLASAYLAVTAWRKGVISEGGPPPSSSRGPAGPNRPKPSGSFVDRMEERWQRRQDGDSSI